ncbi:MAG TPA: hypothetical protein VGK17_00665 [Propionicimonas sp.]
MTQHALARRARLAFIAGAEEWAEERLERPQSTSELHLVLRRYPGDPGCAAVEVTQRRAELGGSTVEQERNR